MENKTKKKMPTDIKVFIIVCSVIAVILIAAVVYIIQPKDVALVQNSRVSGDEFKYYYSQDYQTYAQYIQSSENPESVLNYVKQLALSQAIEVEYILQEAQKNGFKADQKEMDENWATMEQNIINAATTYEMDVDDFCEQSFGTNLKKLKPLFRDAFIAQKYREAKIAEVAVDETKLAAFYEENKASFDYYTVRHILIELEQDAEDAVVQEKQKLAQDILDRVNKGEDFAALALEFSDDDGSNKTGGVYDVDQSTNFVPELKEWAFESKAGDAGIVQSTYGFHVMKLDAVYDTLEANKEVITQAWQANEFQNKINTALNDGTVKVEILDGFSEF